MLETPVDASLVRRLIVEAVGTGLLIVFGPGSVVAALALGNGALDFAGLGIIGISFGLVVALVIYAFGSTSGAHINPAVTFALAVTRRFPVREVVPYWVAQLLGGFVGGLLVVACFGRASVGVSEVGSVKFGPGVGYGQAILVEAVGTALLVLAIMALAVDRRAPAGWAGLMIGLAVTCAVIVLAPLTGAAINPARAFGPWAAASVSGGGAPWSQFGAYVVGSLAGGVVAAVGYDLLARPRDVVAAAEPAQGTQGEVTGSREPAPEPSVGDTHGRHGEVSGGDQDVRAGRRG
jgi:glycerol uptake facilitator protein